MNDMNDELNNTLDRICVDHADKSVFLQSEQGIWPAALWEALTEAGVPQACCPEDQGGAGLSFAEAMVALKRSAYHGIPVPLAETMMAHRLLSAAGLAIPSGVLTVSGAHPQDDLLIEGQGTNTHVSGQVHRVAWAGHAQYAVLAASSEGSGCVVLVDQASLQASIQTTTRNLAGEPRSHLQLNHVPVQAMASLSDASERLRLEGALLRSVQMAGALQRALDHSVQYANERVQFGRPIGKFQAIQHMLAVLAGHVAASSAAADAAVVASEHHAHPLLTAIAKARIGEAASKGTEIAHQVHGAMGFTREHSLHHVTRRLWSWRDEFGNETHWQTQLGRLVVRQGSDQLWSLLTAL
jgi:acyl-CoA dehydrogenase